MGIRKLAGGCDQAVGGRWGGGGVGMEYEMENWRVRGLVEGDDNPRV